MKIDIDRILKTIRLVGLLVIIGTTIYGGITKNKIGSRLEREGKPDVLMVGSGNESMNQAMVEARNTVQTFIDNLNQPKENQRDFSLKVRFEEGDKVEHMWLMEIKYNQGKFVGKLNNDPVDMKKVKFGDEVEVGLDRVSDWVFIEDGKMKGGYTTKVLLREMSEEERKRTLESLDYAVEL
jgi:uncharacterized protein YegJ (DUF2314 family)